MPKDYNNKEYAFEFPHEYMDDRDGLNSTEDSQSESGARSAPQEQAIERQPEELKKVEQEEEDEEHDEGLAMFAEIDGGEEAEKLHKKTRLLKIPFSIQS